MSTHYRLCEAIRMDDLFDGRLESYGITEHVDDGKTSSTRRCLIDGRNWLWVDGGESVEEMTRYGMRNFPGKILAAVAEVFETDIFCEYEPQYWGFESHEELDEAMRKFADQAEEQFYVELIKYLKGEPNDIKPGTIGELKAEIARELVTDNPKLLNLSSRTNLMKGVSDIYDEKHSVTVELTDNDLAKVWLKLEVIRE